MTASRAINNRHYVSEEAARRVALAVQELGYHKSTFARALHDSRSFMIVMLIDPGNLGAVGEFQRYALRTCRAAGYHLLVDYVPDDAASAVDFVSSIIARLHPDGFLLWPPAAHDAAIVDTIRQSGTSCVSLNASAALGVSTVGTDNFAAGHALGVRLIAPGRPLIYLRGRRGDWLGDRREAGLRAALKEAGERADALLVRHIRDKSNEGGLAATRKILREGMRPAAIIADTDLLALGALQAVQEGDIPVPGELSLAAFDDTASARLSVPRLITVEQPLERMATRAVDLIDRGGQPLHYTYDFALEDGGTSVPPVTIE